MYDNFCVRFKQYLPQKFCAFFLLRLHSFRNRFSDRACGFGRNFRYRGNHRLVEVTEFTNNLLFSAQPCAYFRMHKKCAGVAFHIKFLDKLHNAMISNAILDLNSRKIALCVNLFTTHNASSSEEVSWHKVPPHDCAVGVRAKNRHKKKERFHVLFGAC